MLAVGFEICSATVQGYFIEEPGDVALTVIPGLPIAEYIPCILNTSTYRWVGWEQESNNHNTSCISSNRKMHMPYKNTYEFRAQDMWDYSLIINTAPSSGTQLRCYVVDQRLCYSPCYSSWSNITYTGTVTSVRYSCLTASTVSKILNYLLPSYISVDSKSVLSLQLSAICSSVTLSLFSSATAQFSSVSSIFWSRDSWGKCHPDLCI